METDRKIRGINDRIQVQFWSVADEWHRSYLPVKRLIFMVVTINAYPQLSAKKNGELSFRCSSPILGDSRVPC
jgi:hypothetical protein